MRLVLWDHPAADLFAAGAAEGPFEVVRAAPQRSADGLRTGQADVALVPALSVLQDPEAFDVLPGAALSSWSFPYARLVLRNGLAQVASLAVNPIHAQEALLARIILKEHYNITPTFVPHDAGPAALLETGEDASLLAGPEMPSLPPEALLLDLGQEWYELTNYPMVWGVFAMRRDEASPAAVEALNAMARAAGAQRHLWSRAREMTPALHAFYADDLRLRLDDLALAGLTELRQYLYFYGVTEEVADLPLYALPDDPDEEYLE